jgi:hypothetical protein
MGSHFVFGQFSLSIMWQRYIFQEHKTHPLLHTHASEHQGSGKHMLMPSEELLPWPLLYFPNPTWLIPKFQLQRRNRALR